VTQFPTVKYNYCLFPLQPPDQSFSVSRWDSLKLLLKNRAILIRWNSEFDRPEESAFWHVIKDSFVPYHSLDKKRRAELRKGFQNFDVRPVSRNDIANRGYPIYVEAHKRYGSGSVISERRYRADILGKDEVVYDYWGVFIKGTDVLVGYCVNRVFADTVNYVSEKIMTQHLHRHASYPINYVMNEHYLRHRGFRYVDLGAKSMRHDTDVQAFHIRKMGFRKAYCKLRVRFLPGVRFVLFLLQPFRSLFYERSGWRGLVNLLFMHVEYSQYGDRPDVIFFRENEASTVGPLANTASGVWESQVTTFHPTITHLAQHTLRPKEWLLHVFWYLSCRDEYTIYYIWAGGRPIYRVYALSRNFRFTYMNRNDLSIGPGLTDPDYRGRGISPAVIRYVCATRHGCRRFYATTNSGNQAARRGCEKAGFQFFSYGYTTRLLRLFRKLP